MVKVIVFRKQFCKSNGNNNNNDDVSAASVGASKQFSFCLRTKQEKLEREDELLGLMISRAVSVKENASV